ncbi:nucleotide sugar dehydrogenase [Salinadaptatus halalkaliphilus]|uniref:UDP-N-acetyl-D-mannosamine dehydrogenase n=1 Tax=Salinadaptatus halalkaliphilus TaxID=2419781 RepID=A0A4S3TK15_9EURY|nr:nucleotide sugar dehydrogenase [Salinadaptatus halalkaliphilus]THE64432.1 nucleotide sugar dehydrogenase [Salinadaptatus halalkaliphilus]
MTNHHSETERASLYNSAQSVESQIEALRTGSVPVSVYGLGKMGLPLAAMYAKTTGNVLGADIDSAVVEELNEGHCHVKGEPELPELVAELVSNGALSATTDPLEAAEYGTVHVVIVPTPITAEHEPDLSILDAVTDDIGSGLETGDIVIIECTVPPRTTAERVRPALESASGLSIGEFGLAVCPERTSSGRALRDIRGAYPKVVGGIDAESARVTELVYGELTDADVLRVSDATTAEAVKVFEGLYRDVNIALANELATMAEELGIDVLEAIEVANTQPYCDIHRPGPGVGGHCIPFYPYFVIAPFETPTPLLETARAVNDSMPGFVVEKLGAEFEAEGMALSDASILLLGLTYRPGVEEIRASPSLAIAEQLSAQNALVYGVDPMLESVAEFDLQRLSLPEIEERAFDAVVVVTPHEEFESIQWDELERSSGQLFVLDGRDALDAPAITDAGHRLYTIGVGGDRGV